MPGSSSRIGSIEISTHSLLHATVYRATSFASGLSARIIATLGVDPAATINGDALRALIPENYSFTLEIIVERHPWGAV